MKPRVTTPAAGRHRSVSLNLIRDLPDPAPWPNEFDGELSDCDLPVAAGALAALLAVADVLPAPDREALLAVIQPEAMSLRARARVAGVTVTTIRNKALRYRAAMRDRFTP